MTNDTLSPAFVASRSTRRRASLLRLPESTSKGGSLAGLGTLAEDVLFYATMESLFDLPYIPFTEKILEQYPRLPSQFLEALYDRKDDLGSAILASPTRKENAIPLGCDQTPSPQTSPRRRTLTASNVDSHADSVNPSKNRLSPPLPERTPSLTNSVTTSGSDDELCPVTPPIMVGDLDIAGVFSPQSPPSSVVETRAILEKDTSIVADAAISVPSVAPQKSRAAGVPFHLYYANKERSVMSPMYRTKPKGWSSLFIPPARRVTQRRNDGLSGRAMEQARCEETEV